MTAVPNINKGTATSTTTKPNSLLCFCNCGFGATFGGTAALEAAAGDGLTAAAGVAAADSAGIGGKPTYRHAA